MMYSDPKRPPISKESVRLSPDPKDCEGEPDKANLFSIISDCAAAIIAAMPTQESLS